MTIGAKNSVVGVEDTTALHIGSFVAVNVAEYPPPCIGRVLELNSDGTVVVGWIKGGYHKVWSDWMVPDAKDNRKKGAMERQLRKKLHYSV